jgi:hypothetical protein
MGRPHLGSPARSAQVPWWNSDGPAVAGSAMQRLKRFLLEVPTIYKA